MDTGEKSGEAGAPVRAGGCQKTIPANHGAVSTGKEQKHERKIQEENSMYFAYDSIVN